MKPTTPLLILLIVFTSCSFVNDLFHGPNYVDKLGRRQGKWIYTAVNNDDRVETKGRFKDDRPWGKWKYYDVEGNLIKKERYKKKKNGIFIKTKFYYANRRVEKEGMAKLEYHPTNTHYFWIGKWKYYFPDGKLAAIKLHSKGTQEPVILMNAKEE